MSRRLLTIAIVGYGTAGQACALMLARDGHRVEVFERAADIGPVGAGLLLQPVGLRVLWEIGLLDAALAHGRRIDGLYGETPRARGVMDMRYKLLDARLCGLGMQRGALFALLADARPESVLVRPATRIVAASDDGRRLTDERGRQYGPYDLVIAADGSASGLRTHVCTPTLDRAYPWGALWCLLPERDWPHANELRQRYRAARQMVGMLPVGTRPGDAQPRISFFWSLPTAMFERWKDDGTAPWLDEVASLWPDLRDHITAIGDGAHLARASYRDAVVRQWYRGRLVLVGDAAHAMSPQLGQGVNMALLDALALRDALRAGHASIDAALAQFQAERQKHVRIYQFWSRWLTPLFQSDRDRVAALRDLAFLRLGRLWGGRGQMLRVLSGTQHGAFGRLRLPEPFLAALDASAPRAVQ